MMESAKIVNNSIHQIEEFDPNRNSDVIFEHIRRNPGIHLRKIEKDLEISLGTIRHHLSSLEKSGKIFSEKNNLHRYYFTLELKEMERSVIKILRHFQARQILMLILEKRNPAQIDISNAAIITSSSVKWHINRMLEMNIISEISDGRYKRYGLQVSTQLIATLLKTYYSSEWELWKERIVNRFLEFSNNVNLFTNKIIEK